MKTPMMIMGLATATIALAGAVAAEYPERPIQMVIPYGPGGVSDLSARALAGPLGQIVPQPLVLTNRAGAGGAIGSVSVRDADADGYTLLFARVGTHTVNPAMNPNLPYTVDEFRFIAIYELNPVACVVDAGSDIHTIDDLIERVKGNPGEVAFSHPGAGTLPYLGGLMVLDAFGVADPLDNVIDIPTESDAASLTAVLQQTTEFFCGSTSSAAGFVANGQMRPLLVTSPEPVVGFDAPTVADLGKPELQALVGWTGIAGPAGLSDEVVEKWAGWLVEAVKDAEFRGFMDAGGSVVNLMSPDESVAFIESAYQNFRRLVLELDLEL